MTTLEVPVHFDFASSICFVAHRVANRFAPKLAELEISLRWTPVDLTRIIAVERGDAAPAPARENAERVARELSVPLVMPPRWIDSRMANAAAILCETTGREDALRERIFSAHFERGQPLEDGDALAPLLSELGLSFCTEGWDEALGELAERTERARHQQVTGVPTFMFGTWPFGGIQEEHTMNLVFERFASRARRGELH
jgi:predicted DsbA family dithiol-disulfide isomerase